jgi:hydrogenase maturation protein HypF
MTFFSMCPACRREYEDKRDRRFHAEPIACPDCGPRISLLDPTGAPRATGGGAIEAARKQLNACGIVAVKGLGGFHLACDASSERAISRLRDRKSRPHRPLAVMFRDLEVVRSVCELSEKESQELSGPRCPILLLVRRRTVDRAAPSLSRLLAPGREDLGVMLPYTPLHDLLLAPGGPECVVMTSANRSGEPIIADDGEALALLGGVADAILTHDRAIVNRCDDSVAFMEGERLVVLRRSRGFAPLPVPLSRPVRPTLALGAMSANVFAMAAGRRAFLSQHIGDVDSLASLAFLRSAIESFRAWLGIEPEIVAHDMHPDILTTRLAREIADGRRRIAVQHHHAHLASAMAAAGIDEEVQGLVFDGAGWAPDGTIWGGELLVGTMDRFRRAGHLLPLPLPGGDAAVRRPLRLAVACLHALVPFAESAPLELWRRARTGEARTVRRMVDRNFNTPATSSVGRLFDAVAALIGLRDEISYEGQAAMELEQLARRADRGAMRPLRFPVASGNAEVLIDPGPLLHDLVQGVLGDEDRAALALAFHDALAGAAAEACVRVSEAGGPKTVLLCGGVFQNRLLRRLTSAALEEAGLRAVAPGLLPPGDGGLALGQLVVANALKEA